jgi:hypothetical protein
VFGLGTTTTFKAKIHEVKTVVAEMHGLTVDVLEGACRKRMFSGPRQEAMKLAREMTGASYPVIARHFGDRDHTTVIFADRKITGRETVDAKLAARLTECRARIAELVNKRVGKMMSVPAGSSSDWTPPPPMQIAKPNTVVASIDVRAWYALGGQLVAA